MKERKKSKKATNRVKVSLKISLMKNLLAYLIGDMKNRHAVKKIRTFFQLVDETVYTEDADMSVCYAAVKCALDTIMEDGVHEPELILDRILSIPKHAESMGELFESVADIDITSDLALYVENEFIDRLNYVSAIPVLASIRASISKFDKDEFDSYNEVIQEIRQNTSTFNKAVSIRSSASLSHPEIDFNGEQFDLILEKIHRNLTSDKKFVKAGIKALNDLLQGGFQPGRVYVFMAVSGGWKSGLLLNVFIWAAKYNRNLRCRDQAKKPMYLYITQENDSEETIDRMLSYTRCARENKYKSVEESKQAFINEGIIDAESHGIKIHYFRKNEISANDIENLVHDIEADGEYEVKLIVHDYLKRLRPNVQANDTRIDLGEATNDLSELAKLLKIPIITANQLNREAYSVLLQQGANEHKNDLGKKASLTMQSESQLITENADCVIAINKEYLSSSDKWFLTFTDLKNRAAKSNKAYGNRYFAVPFEDGNSMRLIEDFGTDEVSSITSISDSLAEYNPNGHGDANTGEKSAVNRRGLHRKVLADDTFDDE